MTNWDMTISHTYKTLRPLLVTLPYFGINRFAIINKKTIIPQIVCPIILFSLWVLQIAKAAWCFVGVEVKIDPQNMAIYIVLVLGCVSGVLNTFCGLFFFPRRLQIVLRKSDMLRQDPLFCVSYDSLKRRVRILVVGSGFTLLAIESVNIYSNVDVSDSTVCLQASIKNSSALYYLNLLVIYLGAILFLSYKLITLTLIHAVSYIPRQEFQKCNEELKKMMDSSPTAEKIQKIQKRYFEICELTDDIDTMLLPFVSLQMMTVFASICFFIHSFVFGNLNFNVFLFCTIIAVFFLAELTVMLLHGILLNEASKGCLSTTGLLDSTKMDQKSICTLTLFVENMKSTDVGLTFLKLFIFNKSAFITVFSSLISYTIVIIQFQPSSNK